MEKSRRRFAVDRKEGAFWILVPDDGEADCLLSAEAYPHLHENDIADITFAGETILSLELCPEEKEKRLADMDMRLAALFARQKNATERK